MDDGTDSFPDLFDDDPRERTDRPEPTAGESLDLSEEERYVLEVVVVRYRTDDEPPGIDDIDGRIPLARSEIFDRLDELKDDGLITYDGGYRPTEEGFEFADGSTVTDEHGPGPTPRFDVPTDPEAVGDPDPLDPKTLAANAIGEVDTEWLSEVEGSSYRYVEGPPLVTYLDPGETLYSLQRATNRPTVSRKGRTESFEHKRGSLSWLLVTDAAVRVVVAAGNSVGRRDYEDVVYEESIYDIEAVEVGQKGRFVNRNTEQLRFETSMGEYAFDVDDSGVAERVAGFLSERVDARNEACEEMDEAGAVIREATSAFSSGNYREAIPKFDGAILWIESALFTHETDIGLVRPETDSGWTVEAKRPSGRRWVEAVGGHLIDALGAETDDVMAIVSTCRKRRREAFEELLEPHFERAADRTDAGEYGAAADVYGDVYGTASELATYLRPGDVEDAIRRAAGGLIESRLSAAATARDTGNYREAAAIASEALSETDRVADALEADTVAEYRTTAIRCGTAALTAAATEDASRELATLIREWPPHRETVVATLESLSEHRPGRVDETTLGLSRTFDGSGDDEAVASVLRDLLASHEVAVDETSVVGLLDSDTPAVRQLACEILADVGGEAALDAVRALHDDAVYEVRVAALRATKVLAEQLEEPLTDAEERRMERVEIVHTGEGDVVTGTQTNRTVDNSTTVEDSVLNRSDIGPDDAGGDDAAELAYCPGCGADLGDFESVRFCPSCGRELR